MATVIPTRSHAQLARQAREGFVGELLGLLPVLGQAVKSRLQDLFEHSASGREMQERRDALMAYEANGAKWIEGTAAAWKKALLPPTTTTKVRFESSSLSLIGDEVVENKILSSRIALSVAEKAVDLNELKLRIQRVENIPELDSHDVLRPEVTCQLIVEQWAAAGLSRDVWSLVSDLVQEQMVLRSVDAYKKTNAFLVARGVMPEIDLKPLVRRTAGGVSASDSRDGPSTKLDGNASEQAREDMGGRGRMGGGGNGGNGGSGGGGGGGRSSEATGYGGHSIQDGQSGMGPGGGRNDAGPATRGGYGPSSRLAGGAAEETRMMTSGTPLARARQRAQGVLGQLRRMLSDRGAEFDATQTGKPSPGLAEAISAIDAVQKQPGGPAGDMVFVDVGIGEAPNVEQAATVVRQRTTELKKKANTTAEKATIEIVALMFQSILAEERIPAAVRVWFARLQMPVLRVALAEPEFFGSLVHPARQLIDRMGSCVMGFDATTISGSAMEVEIKRIVQVIEQYPETGRRVFQLVYEEFQKFLAKFLTEGTATQRVVSVAQQVELKETMAIQYTIEMRHLLEGVPVRDGIREFLFKVWAEVLAVAAVKNGPQHADTLALKKSASDLLWAASAKPNRDDRTRVIKDLPALLQRLRQGMSLLGLSDEVQEAHIKTIGDTLADAFLSKTDAIAPEQIEIMAKRLANLEDFVGDETSDDLPLDAESLEMMLGFDASFIEIIADGGSTPSAAMLSWAGELQLGHWFTLDHNNKISQVQFVWRSDRKQLHLFAAPSGQSYLVQAKRLAAYLQAGLLVPAEEEALTVRATREALAKLDANPERLLN